MSWGQNRGSGGRPPVVAGRSLWKRRAKALLRPLRRRWLTPHALRHGLSELGVRANGCLLVHSSLSGLGYVPGGARTVVDVLCDYVRAGTLVMPAHTWQWMEAGLRDFDAATTPGCVGAIAEELRRRPGVLRSLHPTHSVAAVGRLADWLVSGHETCLAPCGAGTPYHKLMGVRGQILLAGVGTECNTAFHTIESLAGVPYLLRDEPDAFRLACPSGRTVTALLFRHRPGVSRRFAELGAWLVERGVMRAAGCATAPLALIEADLLGAAVLPEVARDPLFFLTPEARPAWRGQAASLPAPVE